MWFFRQGNSYAMASAFRQALRTIWRYRVANDTDVVVAEALSD